MYQEDFVDYAAFDNSFVNYLFPQATGVLIIHGLKDKAVPEYVKLFDDIMLS